MIFLLAFIFILAFLWIPQAISFRQPRQFTFTPVANERLKRSYIAKHQKQEYENKNILNEFDRDPFVKNDFPHDVHIRTLDINGIIQQKLSHVLDYSALFIAPILWGSYSPMIKGLYSTPGMHAPPPLLFDFISTIVSFNALRLLSHYHGGQVHGHHSQSTTTSAKSVAEVEKAERTNDNNNNLNPFQPQSNGIFAPMTFEMNGGNTAELTLSPIISTTTQSASIWKGGIECGFWLYFGDTLLLFGLQSTSAIRAAIFAQLSTVLVPLIDSMWFSKQPIHPKVWVSCVLALMGVAIVSTEDYTAYNPVLDGADQLSLVGAPTQLSESMGVVESIYTLTPLTTATAATAAGYASNSVSTNWWDSFIDTIQSMTSDSGFSIGLNQGDILALCSAIVTSIYLIRLSHHSNKIDAPLQLASAMSRTEVCLAGISLLIVCSSPLATTLGLDEVDNLMGVQDYISHAFTSPIASGQAIVILAVIWNGAFATALASAAMAYGQRKVSPTLANIVYSTQPCFAALFSYLLLGESMGKPTIFGSSLLLAAVLFSMLRGENNDDENIE